MTLDEVLRRFTAIAPNYRWELIANQIRGQDQREEYYCPLTAMFHEDTNRRVPIWRTEQVVAHFNIDPKDRDAIMDAADQNQQPGTSYYHIRQRLLAICNLTGGD